MLNKEGKTLDLHQRVRITSEIRCEWHFRMLSLEKGKTDSDLHILGNQWIS